MQPLQTEIADKTEQLRLKNHMMHMRTKLRAFSYFHCLHIALCKSSTTWQSNLMQEHAHHAQRQKQRQC